jgi:hypothetical protein
LKKLILLFLFSHLIGLNIVAQNSEENIEWSSDRKLTWMDFQGIEPNGNTYSALNYGGIYLIFEQGDIFSSIVKLRIDNIFNKKLSWTNTDSKYILKHEQLHSDIREVYSRLIRKEILKKKFSTLRDVDISVNEIHYKLEQEMNLYQDKYDQETEHSENIEKQKEWNLKVEKLIEELKEYSNPEIIIEIKK